MRKYLLILVGLLSLPISASLMEVDVYEDLEVSDVPTTIYGSIVYVDSPTSPNQDYGLYSFPLNSSSVAQISNVIKSDLLKIYDGVLIGDKYYVSRTYQEPEAGEEYYLTWFDLKNPDWSEGEGAFHREDTIHLLAYDTTRDDLYSINMHANKLLHINYETGEATVIGRLDFTTIGAAFDDKGQLYVLGWNRTTGHAELYKVDKYTAEAEFIASTGVTCVYAYISGFYYDSTLGKFYWMCYQSNLTALYEMDITGASTRLVRFQDGEKFGGIFTREEINENAPSEVTLLNFLPDSEGSLKGKISFRFPHLTQAGESLSGTLSAKIYINAELYKEIDSFSPADMYTDESITLPENGSYLIRVIVSNNAGKSKEAKYKFWLGSDYPSAVKNIISEVKSNGETFISWTAPQKGINGGYVDASAVRYKIIRHPDNMELESSLNAVEYTDVSISGLMKAYRYEIIPYTEGLVGKSAYSDFMVLGDNFTVPFYQMITEEDTRIWTILDLNSDESKWAWSNSIGGFITPGIGSGSSDDWAFSPPIKLEDGFVYKLSYLLKNLASNSTTNLLITYGPSLDPSDHIELNRFENYSNNTDNSEEETITIPLGEGGVYYIGFYCYSDWLVQRGGVALKEIKVDLAATPGSPNVVTKVIIDYTDNGLAPARLSFVAPSLTVSNETLQDINKINIYRNGIENPVHFINNPVPGNTYEWTDSEVRERSNYYRIIAVNSEGEGLNLVDSVYIGNDYPEAVGNLKLVKNSNGSATLNWEAPEKGIHNGYIGSCNYEIVRSDGEKFVPSGSSLSYTDNSFDITEQNLFSYTVIPSYSDKQGHSSETQVVRFGSAYKAPYSESFAKRSYNTPGWNTSILIGSKEAWYLKSSLDQTDFRAQDEDGGMAVCELQELRAGDKVRLTSPILDLSELDSPLLRFWFTHYDLKGSTKHEHLLVSISIDGGETFKPLEIDTIFVEPSLNKSPVFIGWNLYEFSLADYKNENNLMIAFDAASLYNYGYNLAIDNFAIVEQPGKDLKLNSFELPSRLLAGFSNTSTVIIRNLGKETATGYDIKIYKGEEVISTEPGVPLESGEYYTYKINTKFPLSDINKKYTFRAEIDYSGDEQEYNNISVSLSGAVERSVYSAPLYLEAAPENEGIDLAWDAPVNPKSPVLIEESFEEYQAFIIDGIGEWTVIDIDQYPTENLGPEIFNIYNYDNVGKPMAYQVFNSKKNSAVYNDWDGRTGQQVIASFGPIIAANNDDWLISPELNGAGQLVTFYAKTVSSTTVNRERFIFYYSSEGKEIEDFEQLSDGEFIEVPSSWTQYSFVLPEGAHYFAIRCVSYAGLTFIVDDIYFASAGEDIAPIGYNIYRNDSKINDKPIDALEYKNVPLVEGEKNVYAVTAVYADGGESNYSNEHVFDYSNIENSLTANIFVYSVLGGIQVEGCEGKTIDIYAIDGSIVYRTNGKGSDYIALKTGIYIVKANNKVAKVIVK